MEFEFKSKIKFTNLSDKKPCDYYLEKCEDIFKTLYKKEIEEPDLSGLNVGNMGFLIKSFVYEENNTKIKIFIRIKQIVDNINIKIELFEILPYKNSILYDTFIHCVEENVKNWKL